MLPGTQFTAPPPTTPGEVGAGPRTPGEVTLGLVDTPGLIVLGLVTPGLVVVLGLVVPGLVRDGFVVVGLVGPIDELPIEDPVIGCGVEPKVPVIGSGVEPNVPPAFGLEIPGAELPPMVGEVLNEPVPVIGAGPVPGAVVPKAPVVPEGATGDTPVAPGVAVPGAAPTAPVPPAAPGAAVCAKAAGAAATNVAATAEIMDFRLSMRVSFELQKENPGAASGVPDPCIGQQAPQRRRSASTAFEVFVCSAGCALE